MMEVVLGIRDGHDSGAAIIMKGRIIAAVNEERLTRVKMDGSFPVNAMRLPQ